MNKHQMMMQIRSKKLALLITDARLAMKREPEECAIAMGVDSELFRQFETGEISPTLPQLESLACFLNVQMDHFWGKSSKSEAGIWELETVLERLKLQDKHIAETIRTSREEAGQSLDEMEEQTGIEVEQLQKFESGEIALSLPKLEALCSLLEIDLPALFDQEGMIGDWHYQQRAAESFNSMSEELLVFVNKPVNHPYLQLAKNLSELPAEKLRAIAESLLEITL